MTAAGGTAPIPNPGRYAFFKMDIDGAILDWGR